MAKKITRACLFALQTMLEAKATNRQIAEALNAQGHTTSRGTPWNVFAVNAYRKLHANNVILPERPKQPIIDIYPYIVPLGTDFYCRPPGQRRWQE